jgi:endonuclease/exonuclease/phosphatase family metal-dependent hydrolase
VENNGVCILLQSPQTPNEIPTSRDLSISQLPTHETRDSILQSNLSLATFNCKNIKTSKLMLNELATTAQIILLQEHWLYNYELPLLNSLHANFNAVGKSVDDEDPITPLQKPRGYGGVAILWKKSLDRHIEVLKEGNNRMQAILLKPSAKEEILIISCYMPSRGRKEVMETYEETLAHISDLLGKYPQASIILGGDLNTDLESTTKSGRKSLLEAMMREENLVKAINKDIGATFVHPNGNDSSCIDYFLINRNSNVKTKKLTKLDTCALNTSDHYPLILECELTKPIYSFPDNQNNQPNNTTTNGKIPGKLNWNKIDITRYQTEIEDVLREKIEEKSLTSTSKIEENVDLLVNLINKAALQAAPRKKLSKNTKHRKQTWNAQISQAVQESKRAHWEWKSAGKPSDPTHHTVRQRKAKKKKLRSQINLEEARKRQKNINDLTEASQYDHNKLFKLVKAQRSSKEQNTPELIMGEEILTTSDEIRDGWAKHFGNLAIPQNHDGFDNDYKREVEADLKVIEDLINSNSTEPLQVSVDQVQKAICSLNTNKAPDVDGISAEHIKHAGIIMTGALTQIINAILQERKIPQRLKLGLLTPIWKKNDKRIPGNYRGITIISTIGKILEAIIRDKITPVLKDVQNPLQRGFTKGTSPLNAALIMHEAILHARNKKNILYIALLDAKSAFDVVSHESLLRKLYYNGVRGAIWSLIADTFRDAKTVVKWQGKTSSPFSIKQGVRQGGILSTEEYKVYNNDLLDRLADSSYGTKIGEIQCCAPTCADDIALLANSRADLQAMLDMCHSYSQYERFQLQPTKSMVLIYNSNIPINILQSQNIFHLGKDTIPVVEQATHLGIVRDINSAGINSTIKNNISKARKTLYSLMGTGMYGTNGLPPAVNLHLFSVYVSPVLTYGLEILLPSEKEIKDATQFHEKTLRQITSLTDNCAKPAIYILTGEIPLIGQIHSKALTLFGNILRDPNTIEYGLAVRQLRMTGKKEASWFKALKMILCQYDLPPASELLEDTPDKRDWARTVKKAIHSYWRHHITSQAATFSSLSYLNTGLYTPGVCHPTLSSIRSSYSDIRRTAVANRFITGTVILQANRHKFNQYEVDPACPLCNAPKEDRQHVLLYCNAYKQEREETIKRIIPYLNSIDEGLPEEKWMQLLIDCSTLIDEKIINIDDADDIYFHARTFMAKTLRRRLYKLEPSLKGVT